MFRQRLWVLFLCSGSAQAGLGASTALRSRWVCWWWATDSTQAAVCCERRISPVLGLSWVLEDELQICRVQGTISGRRNHYQNTESWETVAHLGNNSHFGVVGLVVRHEGNSQAWRKIRLGCRGSWMLDQGLNLVHCKISGHVREDSLLIKLLKSSNQANCSFQSPWRKQAGPGRSGHSKWLLSLNSWLLFCSVHKIQLRVLTVEQVPEGHCRWQLKMTVVECWVHGGQVLPRVIEK